MAIWIMRRHLRSLKVSNEIIHLTLILIKRRFAFFSSEIFPWDANSLANSKKNRKAKAVKDMKNEFTEKGQRSNDNSEMRWVEKRRPENENSDEKYFVHLRIGKVPFLICGKNIKIRTFSESESSVRMAQWKLFFLQSSVGFEGIISSEHDSRNTFFPSLIGSTASTTSFDIIVIS